jgi:pSer/pThr/pTyr-binding forkhead associated (FHA) protein
MTLASHRLDGVVSAGAALFPDAGAVCPPAPRFSSLDRRATRTYMPVTKVNDQQFSLRPGPNRLGAGADAGVSATENVSPDAPATARVDHDVAPVTGRATGSAPVRANRVPLVDLPPLEHLTADSGQFIGRGAAAEILGSAISGQQPDPRKADEVAAPATAADGEAPSSAPLIASDGTDARPILALLDVESEGPAKGNRYEIRVPLAHIGRGAHNDVVIPDESVSDTHAKLQRRDDGWYVTDLGSTNGTYVAGQRLTTERRLDGAQNIRLGGVRVVFRPRDRGVVPNPERRAVASLDRTKSSNVVPVAAPQVTTALPEPKAARRAIPAWVWAVVVLAVVAVAAFFLLNR